MIITRHLNDDPTQEVDWIQYFGEDVDKINASERVKPYLLKNMYKECITWDGEKGYIVGLEDNITYNDYYFIVYVPDNPEKIVYELTNALNIIDKEH